MSEATFRYKNPVTSSSFNTRFGDILDSCVLSGFYLRPNSNKKFDMTYAPDVSSVLILGDGVRIEESNELDNLFTVEPNGSSVERYDMVYVRYVHGTISSEVQYFVKKGPTDGSIDYTHDEMFETLIAVIKVPPNFQESSECEVAYPIRGLAIKNISNSMEFKTEVHFESGATTITPTENNHIVNKQYVDNLVLPYTRSEAENYNKDHDFFEFVKYYREDTGVLWATSHASVVSKSGNVEVITYKEYEEDGITLKKVENWKLEYDSYNNIITKYIL